MRRKIMQYSEILSFHHTKPWGFGEGGAVICETFDEKIVRQLINFGVDRKNHYSVIFQEIKKRYFSCQHTFEISNL